MFAAQDARVDRFVARHFSVWGSLRLHRSAVGLDLLRAPANALLSPVLLIVRLLSWALAKIGLRRAARWLASRRLLLRTTVAARVETLILSELLEIPMPASRRPLERADLQQAILGAPHLRSAIRHKGPALADRLLDAVTEYSGTRSAIAEFSTALVTLGIGALVFQTLTPGVISMAPGVAAQVARGDAIANFPLGATLGAGWYGVFSVDPTPLQLGVTVCVLMALGALVTSFAGVFADPVQSRLGIHHRRLRRLVETFEAEIGGQQEKRFVAREHFLARVFDIWDAAMSLLKMLRG
ncbi:DUF6635 family protein [Donghicola sp. XS_ASV15]|uniref:DUF6635 family protein n=1 Tax=Donghicola sp. XS_ASV15 TaxID=3241295 RepID=UPI0035126DD9